MSPRSSSSKKRSIPAEPDIYTSLLFVATGALVTGLIFLVLELAKYDWQVAT